MCDCRLAWLPRWLEEWRVHVVRPEATTCAGPGPLAGQPLLGGPLAARGCGECGAPGVRGRLCRQAEEREQAGLCPPGEEYVACLPDGGSGPLVPVVFLAAWEEPLAPEACGAVCFAAGRGLAACSDQGLCLCGPVQLPNASEACLAFCSTPPLLTPACGGPTLLQHTFPTSPGATLVGPPGPLASGQSAAFHVSALLPVNATRWDFGDGSPEVGVAGPATSHRYVLPGHYHVTAVLALGTGSAQLGVDVQVEAAPATLELHCPPSVHSDTPLELGIRNRGGSGLKATYSIVALDPGQGGTPPPP